MSGGSYNYLYSKEAETLLEQRDDQDLTAMLIRLEQMGNADDVTIHLYQVLSNLAMIRECLEETDKILHIVSPVLRAVEWRDSYDIGEDQLQAALEEWHKAEAERRHRG